MNPSEKVNFITNWIKNYVNEMPSKAQSLVIGISGGIDSSVSSTLSAMTGLKTIVLSMPIIHEEQFYDPNTLKIIQNIKGDILYTSRAPIPYCTKWTTDHNAKRIYGIFGFQWEFLQKFTKIQESPLEIVEACDSNRLYDNGLTQRVADYPYVDSFAVDTPEDAEKVEAHIKADPYWRKYNEQ